MLNPSHSLSFLPAGSSEMAIKEGPAGRQLTFVVSPACLDVAFGSKSPQTPPVPPPTTPSLMLRNLQWLPNPLLMFQTPHPCLRPSPFGSTMMTPLFAQPLPERACPSTLGHLRHVPTLRMMFIIALCDFSIGNRN